MTELLAEKINALRSIIQALKLERFQRELMLDDISESSGNENADAGMHIEAEAAKSIIASCTRRIAIRMAKLDELEAEKKTEDNKVRKDTAKTVAKEPPLPREPK